MIVSDADLAKARRLLQEVLPWAREKLDEEEATFYESHSALGEAALAHVTEDSLDGLHIYPGPKGGWHADVNFRGVPPGFPNSIGSPVQHPFATREEAMERGRYFVVMLLYIARQNANRPPPKSEPVFLLHGFGFKLKSKVPEMVASLMPELRDGYGSPLQAAGRIESFLDENCPDGFDAMTFPDWPQTKQVQLIMLLQGAVMSGLYRYPMIKDEAPG